MTILRIQHQVLDYDRWKAAFDSDPIDRAGSGVRRHRVMRAVEDADDVMIDLEFDDRDAAASMLERLRELWRGIDVVRDPQGTLVDVVEAEEY
jgi:hypothetical protein